MLLPTTITAITDFRRIIADNPVHCAVCVVTSRLLATNHP